MPSPDAAAPGGPERSLHESRQLWGLEIAAWVDTVLYGVVCVVALSAMGTTFGGGRYLVVGAVGVVVGLAAALGTLLLHRGPVISTVLVFAAFVVAGSVVVVPADALFGVLPTPASVAALLEGAVGGWAKVVTTLPPVGDSANLLAIPYLCGFVAASVGASVSLRTRRPTLALALPILVLAAGILIGTDAQVWPPAATALFAALCVAWGSIRQRAQQRTALPFGAGTRWITGLVALFAAGAIAVLMTYAPLIAGSQVRMVLRDNVEPPVDLRDYPSPLAGFRRYLDPSLTDEVLFTIDGLPPGARVRLATLDRYDGLVYQTAGAQADERSSGYFQRVGTSIPTPVDGASADVTVEVGAYDDIWLPGAGWFERIEFSGERGDELAEAFRYNVVTGTGAVTAGLRAGDRFTATVTLPPEPPADWQQSSAAPVPQPPVEQVPDAVGERAVEFSGDQTTDGQRVATIAEYLNANGKFSHGDERQGEARSPAGHSASRVALLLEQTDRMVGDAEQYAATMALMARDRGVPARVVMGFAPETSGDGPVEVRGGDVTAWVEVALGDGVWVPLDPTPPEDQKLEEFREEPNPLPNVMTPPPPSTVPRLEDVALDEQVDDQQQATDEGFVLPLAVVALGTTLVVPLLIVAAVTAAMAGLKARRRRRRRHEGPPSSRVAAGWDEVLDLARDLGDVVPSRATRRETAVLLARPGVAALASTSDATVFGPTTLSDADVDAYWTDVEVARHAMLGPLGRFERWKATVNPTSLRRRPAGASTRQGRRKNSTSA